MTAEANLESLRRAMVGVVERELTPVALKYQYARVPLEESIKWRPLVLLLGNYSSGKSTFINELLERPIQETGQAPTDDSFTVITFSDGPGVEDRDGRVLLHDPQYPFAALQRHGQKFAAHFRLKQVNAPVLRNLALIDTPGMLDSVTEKDRGYNYQEVVGDLAGMADLILVLFDPHKAGTIQEIYKSLRETLPRVVAEDRILFVLNRIDECETLTDLLRVYGTLCWNLSQMTGRKDIPPIHLTYSPMPGVNPQGRGYLQDLANQRDIIKSKVLDAPRHRLDHLASYIEEHGRNLTHLLEALTEYAKRYRRFLFRMWATGLALSLIGGVLVYVLLNDGTDISPLWVPSLGGIVMMAVLLVWGFFTHSVAMDWFFRRERGNLDVLTPLATPARVESWEAVKSSVQRYLEHKRGRLWLPHLKGDMRRVKSAWEKASRDARTALTP